MIGRYFSQNRTDHDDILGDAYEYLMRHFATESGKSKGQFYTPTDFAPPVTIPNGASSASSLTSSRTSASSRA